MTVSNNRLKILSNEEIELLYGYLPFTTNERHQYFSLSEVERSLIKDFAIKSRVFFILQLGYFKAQKQFFDFSPDSMKDDLLYIYHTHFRAHPEPKNYKFTFKTRIAQQQIILKHCRYRLCEKQERENLAIKATQLAKVSSKPIYIFRELLQWLEEKRIVIPHYSYLQDAIGMVLQNEQRRLIDLTKKELNEDDVQHLQSLLQNPQGLYEVTLLKRSPKDFGTREMKREVGRGHKIYPLYKLSQKILSQLEISNDAIK